MDENTQQLLQLVWIFFSIITLAKWLLRHKLGRTSLNDIAMPQNSLNPLDIIIALIAFLVLSGSATAFVTKESPFLRQNIVYACLNLTSIIFLTYLLNAKLTNGLKSILPTPTQIPNQLLKALCYFIPATGLAICTLTITIYICMLYGYDEIQQHQQLKILIENRNNIPAIIAFYLSAAIITPILEEILFRGIIQTAIINTTGNKWLGIIVAALIFASMHANLQHFPALLLLGIFFGYSFVKQQSLLIPIIMHALFNALNVTGTLLNNY